MLFKTDTDNVFQYTALWQSTYLASTSNSYTPQLKIFWGRWVGWGSNSRAWNITTSQSVRWTGLTWYKAVSYIMKICFQWLWYAFKNIDILVDSLEWNKMKSKLINFLFQFYFTSNRNKCTKWTVQVQAGLNTLRGSDPGSPTDMGKPCLNSPCMPINIV